MVHDIPMPRTLLHGLGAAAITLLTFGLGPMVGLTAAALPAVEVLDGPIEGAPEGAIDLSTFVLTLEDVGLAAVATEPAPSDGDVTEVRDAGEAEPELAQTAAGAPPRPATPDPTQREEADRDDVPNAWELARTGQRPVERPKGKRCESERTNPRIERTAKGSFAVDRSLVTWYIGHLGELNRLGWSSKQEGPDGSSVGMRIGGVTCGNDLHLAGIRSGDVVHRVNGHEVRSIPQAIGVYRKVRKDTTIQVELTRRGKPMTLTYEMT